ncbi:PREDICTED: LOW QUALITY PROTEIN: uncharacterized protein LOC108575519 [Habropoda laboriosa]|uniref:LOW QUALITY PROTEIN: uncharacterized protein LOC108575519 n=1 Tax=Habropoda laboriosa TaxID=597456 RepID=UPI00083D5784|nr:PREDICTED: LOW QUALITY PROTEIN: uncharacterized protein LOC108575519 [Habropoda laboriosa]
MDGFGPDNVSAASVALQSDDPNRKETRLVCHSVVPLNDHHHPLNPDRENQVQYVAKATLDCTNGYVCLMFHRRDNHIIELQLSEWGQQPDVCDSTTFSNQSMPYMTFITPEPITRQCPNLGRYEIVSVLHSRSNYNVDEALGLDGEQNMASAAEVQDVRVTPTLYPGSCRYGNVRRLDIGCKTPDRMEFATSCRGDTPWGKISQENIWGTAVCIGPGIRLIIVLLQNGLFPEYWCHGTWIENDTAYLVASTDVGRYCLVYSASAAATGSRELSVTGHLASCPRAAHRHLVSWQVNLTSYAQCGDISTATSWTFRISASVYILAVLGILFGRYVAR